MTDLSALLRPGSIALVGASPKPDSFGANLLRSIRSLGYEGGVHLVNPRYDSIDGQPSHAAIPDGTDCAAFVLGDALLVDAFDKTGFAPSLANREFFESAFAKLSGNGVLVINLAGEKESYAGLIGEAMHVFDDQVIVIAVPDDGNHVLFAFKERHFEPRWRWVHNFAKELRANHGLDFPAFAQKLERSAKISLARREAIRRW